MDIRSSNLLFKKYGLLFAIALPSIGLGFMILVSYALTFLGATLKIYEPMFNYFVGIISRSLAFIVMLLAAKMFCLTRRINFTFKNFGKSISIGFLSYAISIAFILNAFSGNLAMGNTLNMPLLGVLALENILVGLFEELIIRGISMNILRIKYKKAAIVIIAQALIFMSLHVINYFLGGRTIKSMITQLVITLVMGLYYGYVYYRTKSFLGLAFMHAFYDFSVSLAFAFKPTGEFGKLYARADETVIIYATMFAILFVSLKLFVRSIEKLKEYKEEFEWNMARFGVPILLFFSKKVLIKNMFSITFCNKKMYENNYFCQCPEMPMKPRENGDGENPNFLDYLYTFLYN